MFHTTNTSTWVIIASLLVSAVEMHPSIGSLFALGIQALLLFIARWLVIVEYRDSIQQKKELN